MEHLQADNPLRCPKITGGCRCNKHAGHHGVCQSDGDTVATPSGALEDAFEAQEFYELMQAYRHAPMVDQLRTVRSFEAVKAYARAVLASAAPGVPQAEFALDILCRMNEAPTTHIRESWKSEIRRAIVALRTGVAPPLALQPAPVQGVLPDERIDFIVDNELGFQPQNINRHTRFGESPAPSSARPGGRNERQ